MLTTSLIPFVGGWFCCSARQRLLCGCAVWRSSLTLQLLLSVALLIPFDPSVGTPQLVEFTPWVSRIGLDYRLAVDGLSLPLILINAALTLVSAVCTRDFDQRPRIYFSMLLLISGAVNGAFLADNLLLFVIFYELELIPLWLLIAAGGENRGYASTSF